MPAMFHQMYRDARNGRASGSAAYETGALRRLYVRGKENVQKRLLLQAAACNLALLLRTMIGAGTPRALQDVVANLLVVLLRLISAYERHESTSRSRRLSSRVERRIVTDTLKQAGRKTPI